MPKTEAWWVCGTCGKPVYRVGKGGKAAFRLHQEVCPSAGLGIKQVPQKRIK